MFILLNVVMSQFLINNKTHEPIATIEKKKYRVIVKNLA